MMSDAVKRTRKCCAIRAKTTLSVGVITTVDGVQPAQKSSISTNMHLAYANDKPIKEVLAIGGIDIDE